MHDAQNLDSIPVDTVNDNIRQTGYNEFPRSSDLPDPAGLRELTKPQHHSSDVPAHAGRSARVFDCDEGDVQP